LNIQAETKAVFYPFETNQHVIHEKNQKLNVEYLVYPSGQQFFFFCMLKVQYNLAHGNLILACQKQLVFCSKSMDGAEKNGTSNKRRRAQQMPLFCITQ
jgi:hypothetical protein